MGGSETLAANLQTALNNLVSLVRATGQTEVSGVIGPVSPVSPPNQLVLSEVDNHFGVGGISEANLNVAGPSGSNGNDIGISFQASASTMVNRLYALQERWAARFTHRLLPVSNENAAKYLRSGIGRPDQYRTVYSGLDLARYADDGRPAGF